MKIAEFFVALGFDIKGDKELLAIDRGLVRAERNALMLLTGVTALNAGFALMMNSALNAAVSLQKFGLTTGLSTEELQRWQYAAKLANVEGEEVLNLISGIQKAQADIKLGQGNVAPFQFFGLGVNSSPFAILKQLNEQFQKLDPAIARTMASQMGINENLFQWLRRSNLELDKFNSHLLLTNKQQAALQSLNKTWQDITYSIRALGNRFAESFAGPLAVAGRVLQTMIEYLGKFVDWLGKATPGATAARWALAGLLAVMVALGIALTGISITLAVVIGALKLLALGALPILAALAPISLLVTALAAGLVVLVLLLDDFWTACKGGKSAFNWNDGLILTVRNVERLARAMEWVIGLWGKFKTAVGQSTLMDFGNAAKTIMGDVVSPVMHPFTGGSSVSQENNVNIHVDGAGDPGAVGRAVGRSVKEELVNAAYQVPSPQW